MNKLNSCIVKRLLNDWREFCKDAPEGITGFPSKENICFWHVTLLSPIGKPIQATLYFHENYPYQPPVVNFPTILAHPNIDSDGNVCIDKLDWTAAHTVWSLLLAVQCLLAEPNPEVAVNPDAAAKLLHNPNLYLYEASQFFEKAELYYRLHGEKSWLHAAIREQTETFHTN